MANKLFGVKVICPERVFFEGDVEMLEMRTTEGEIGVLADHIPLTAVIAPGILRIMTGDTVKEASLNEGFVEILGDRVMILAESCEWPDEIDVARAQEAKTRAERRLKGSDGEIDEIRAELALRKALVRIDLAEKYK